MTLTRPGGQSSRWPTLWPVGKVMHQGRQSSRGTTRWKSICRSFPPPPSKSICRATRRLELLVLPATFRRPLVHSERQPGQSPEFRVTRPAASQQRVRQVGTDVRSSRSPSETFGGRPAAEQHVTVSTPKGCAFGLASQRDVRDSKPLTRFGGSFCLHLYKPDPRSKEFSASVVLILAVHQLALFPALTHMFHLLHPCPQCPTLQCLHPMLLTLGGRADFNSKMAFFGPAHNANGCHASGDASVTLVASPTLPQAR
jgi:hypothetical protein